MKTQKIHKKGFTLIEVTIVIIVSLTLAVFSTSLLNQAFAFFKIQRSQSFLTESAPAIGAIVAGLTKKADRFELHTNYQAYSNNSAQVSTQARCLTLISIQNNLPVVRGHIFMNSTTGALEFYQPSASNPAWVISQSVSDSVFNLNRGILQMTLTGENGESLTYSR